MLRLAALFLLLFSLALTIAPAVRERNWEAGLRWSHWAGFAIWLGFALLAHRRLQRHLPESDPYLFPLAALLAGWGLLTVFRLLPAFGFRQSLWLAVSGAVFLAGLRLDPTLRFLRRYKYLLLTSGLLLTSLTLVLGTNPLGSGPRLWLGCCGVYFQPSEPLKLLLVIYLAAYLSERIPIRVRPLPPLAPTILVTGAALALLVVQRDLGTASLFIFLYTTLLYLASGRKRVLLFSLLGIGLAGVSGYILFDVVQLRVDAWLNPWLDPSGRSYQIVQSLLAIANGGLGGRGPGMGSPGLVPVSISDFIFSAIAEETGLVGTLGLLCLLGLFSARGLLAALNAPDKFRRLLAAGLTAYIGSQAILIIGGTIRLLPLTGVTLPFVSYGGSSLLTSFIALLLLLLITSQPDDEPAPLAKPQPFAHLGGLLLAGFLAAASINSWWAVQRGPDLLARTDNPRRAISDRYVPRGSLVDRSNLPITVTEGEAGEHTRVYLYPDLAPVTGYTHPVFGQAGLEAILDPYLRGLQGNPASLVWWERLLYGQPPPGLDVRIGIDLGLQELADELLGTHTGAIVLLNADSGEILVMASHPAFDPNLLDEIGFDLAVDPTTPLLNRAAQGLYPPGSLWNTLAGATGAGGMLLPEGITSINRLLGFSEAPSLRLQVAEPTGNGDPLRVSPLQVALAGAGLSAGGIRPAPLLATAVNTPIQGWVILPPLGEAVQAMPTVEAEETAASLIPVGETYWQVKTTITDVQTTVSWFLGGTPPGWLGSPLVVVVLLEEDNPALAAYFGLELLSEAVSP